MALPEVTLPRGFPFFLAAQHGFVLTWAFELLPRQTGLTRSRRVRTRNIRLQDVALVLSEAQAAAFMSWFERDLVAGSLPFSAQIMTPGGEPLWWACEWVEMPSTTAMHFGRWRIEGQVRIGREPPTVDGPVRTSFRAEFRAPLVGSSRISVGKLFAAEISVPLTGEYVAPGARNFAAEITVGMT